MDIWEILSRYVLGSIQVLLQQAIILQVGKSKHPLHKLLISLAFIRLLTFLMELLVPFMSSMLYAFLWVVIYILSYLFIFKASVVKSLLMGLGQFLLVVVMEYVLYFIASLMGYSPFVDDYHVMTYVRLVATAILLLTYMLVRRRNMTMPSFVKEEKLHIVIVYLLFLILFTTPRLIDLEQNLYREFTNTEIYNMLLFFVFFIYNVIYIRSILRISNVSQRLEETELYLDTIEQSNKQLRVFKHDYDNVISTIGNLIDNNQFDELKQYSKEMAVELLYVNNRDLVSSELNDNPLLRGIIMSKLSLAELWNIELRLSILCEVKLHYCSSVDFSRIIGILLDNALEAAIDSQDKYIEMSIHKIRTSYKIIIVNSISHSVELDKIFNDSFTTKETHSGIGLYEANAIIQKYRKQGFPMSLIPEVDEDRFTMILTLGSK